MGRQPYMNLLALGRSPYEAPENPPHGYVAPVRRAEDSVNADGYVQEYDARGHPINPSSKALARQLRRAKNDILSTMGIVVSGEDGNLGISKERQHMSLLSTENDYGLAMATLDQVFMFCSSWWTTSLAARIQTFKKYTHVPFMQIIHLERNELGLFSFYCGGLPTWTASFVISVCRNHFLEPALEYLHGKVLASFDNDTYKSSARVIFMGLHSSFNFALLILLGQAHLFSLLQTLHILPAWAAPSLRSLLPFSHTSLIQLPSLPSTFSAYAIGNFGINLLTSPFTGVYMYVYLRPLVESRIYRILRRRLPKPDRPDNLSLRVAAENDLIEWTVPSLGGRSDEEYHRSDLTISEELKYELRVFRYWVLGLLGFHVEERSAELLRRSSTSRSIQHHLEQINRDLDASTAPMVEHLYHPEDELLMSSMHARVEQQLSGHVEGGRPRTPTPDASTQQQFDTNQILSSDEQRMSQSPLQLAADYFDGDSQSQGRTAMEETFRIDTSLSPQLHGPHPDEFHHHHHHRHSCSNTLFSHPSTPESSPLPSPRVRASLVHQNSDVITMQLELLRSNHGSPAQTRTNQENTSTTIVPLSTGIAQETELTASEIDRTANELLDSILSNRGPGVLHPDQPPDHNILPQTDDLEEVAQFNSISNSRLFENFEEAQYAASLPPAAATAATEHPPSHEPSEVPASSQPTHQAEPATATIGDVNRSLSHPISTQPPHRSRSERFLLPDHRVTILSSLPVDSLSSHLAFLLGSLIFYPLESMYLRNLATQYLASPHLLAALPIGSPAPSTATILGLRTDVRSVTALCGGGSRADMLAYLGKMGLAMGMQALVSAVAWGMGTALTVLVGTRKFGWGDL
ncbi:hypothetical protein PABG_01475 [Paracoccidioides brasiliensis Pb03]|nr:hypothetical protein PABG_01475 [Paracoccidioides brasiliensis Pb03]